MDNVDKILCAMAFFISTHNAMKHIETTVRGSLPKHTVIIHMIAGKDNDKAQLESLGINAKTFFYYFNKETSDRKGEIVRVTIILNEDGTYESKIDKKRLSQMIKEKMLGRKEMSLSREDLREIAGEKFGDLNAANEEATIRRIAGTARSMGIKIE